MSAPLSPPNTWAPTTGCTSPTDPSIAYGLTLTGVPATIGSVNNGLYCWSITLNDGGAPPNFSIDRYDNAGDLLDHPMTISGVDGSIHFADPVLLAADPTQPLGAVTKQYVDAQTGGAVPEAPEDGSNYVRNNASWTPMGGPYLPLTGGTVTGSVAFSTAAILTVNGSNSLVLNGASGAQRSVLGMTANVARWTMSLGDGAAESGGNAGSNFTLAAYGAAGTFLFNPLVISRATGVVTFSAMPSIPGGASGQVLTTNGAGGLSWATGSGSGGGIAEAPTDGQLYGRENATWVVVPTGGSGGIPDAPSDGSAYSRKNATWAHIASADITDLTTTLGPYALNSSLANYALISSVPLASTSSPLMDGTAAVGSGTAFARADHVHPSDTSRYAASNPAGYQTAAQVTAALSPYALTTSLPAASTATPLVDSGTGAVGTATTWARADHVHPQPAISGGDTVDIAYFGDGSDGAVSITTTVALTRDMYYTDLAISGAGILQTNGFRIFVSGTLDLSAAGAGAITHAVVFPANNGVVNGGGAGSTSNNSVSGYCKTGGGASGGTPGANAITGPANGTTSAAQAAPAATGGGLGGLGGIGGAGGGNLGNTGGGGGNISPVSFPTVRFRLLTTSVFHPSGAFYGGVGGTGGGSGGSSSGASSAGGGGGGSPGTFVLLFARTILRGAGTAVGAINAAGGNGGNGGPVNAPGAAGGGGGGGGGGFVYIVYRFLTGALAANAINVAGGNGGNSGTGASQYLGSGGNGGTGGVVAQFNIATNAITYFVGGAPGAPSGATGGVGGVGSVAL